MSERRRDHYVIEKELRKGDVYLMISFLDADLLVPDISTVTYLGRDLYGEGRSSHYFQDCRAVVDGANESKVIEAPPDGLMNFYSLSAAAEVLRDCDARRRASGRR